MLPKSSPAAVIPLSQWHRPVTYGDLQTMKQALREEILQDIKNLLAQQAPTPQKKWLKNNAVRDLNEVAVHYRPGADRRRESQTPFYNSCFNVGIYSVFEDRLAAADFLKGCLSSRIVQFFDFVEAIATIAYLLHAWDTLPKCVELLVYHYI
jgi:hypothetical protein